MDTPDDDLTVPDDLTVDEGMIADDEFANPFEEIAVPPARWPLAVVAALVVGALGVVVWSVANAMLSRELVGASVVIGLLVGYVVREVSRRATLPARVVAVVVTALVCAAGAIVGDAAYVSAKYKGTGFWDLLDHYESDLWHQFKTRPNLQFAIFAVALVVAYLAAGPAKPKAVAADDDEAAEDAGDADEAADETGEPGGDE